MDCSLVVDGMLNDIVHRFGRCISSELAVAAIALGYKQLAHDIFLLGVMSASDMVDAMAKDVEEGHLRIFRWLSAFQSYKIDVNSVDSAYSRTMLHAAAWGGYQSLVLHLLRIGADPHAQDCFGQSPLHIVATRWDKNFASMLLAWRANPNAQDSLGRSPLHIAAVRRNTSLARIMLNWEADVNSSDHEQRRSLHYAMDSLQTVRLLLSRGAEVHKRDITLYARSPTVRFLLMKAERKYWLKRTQEIK